MSIRIIVLACGVLALGADNAKAQSACVREVARIVTVAGPAGATGELSQSEIRVAADDTTRKREAEGTPEARRFLSCVLGELLKRLGDPQADDAYRIAVGVGVPGVCEGEHHLLYGDYLRNYRGPGQPLVDGAASQYYQGLACSDTIVRNQIRRSLLALYERDGVALSGSLAMERPWLFFNTHNQGARSPDDLGAVDTLRSLSSMALVSEQSIAVRNRRPARPLEPDQLTALVNNSFRKQTSDRIRLRYRAIAVDAVFEGTQTRDSQVFDFADPASETDVGLRLWGVGGEGVFDLYPAFDISVRADLRWGLRSGLIEAVPDSQEALRTTTVRTVVSRFVGPDKINAEFVVNRADITQHIREPIERRDDLWGLTGRYQIFRPLGGSRPYERPIASRGSEVFGGLARRTEQFGPVDVQRQDYFAGASLKGLPGGGAHSYDVTYQRTWFRSEQAANAAGAVVLPLANRQHEDYVTVLYRLVDKEQERNIDLLPTLVFLNAVGLFSFGQPSLGPTAFERTRFGGQLDAKLASQARGGNTWLLSGRYERQQFGELALTAHVAFASLSLGF
jgi:hypothetical protein